MNFGAKISIFIHMAKSRFSFINEKFSIGVLSSYEGLQLC